MIMKAAGNSETSVNFYETKRRNTPEGCLLKRKNNNRGKHILTGIF
jgi:hypothetical protein